VSEKQQSARSRAREGACERKQQRDQASNNIHLRSPSRIPIHFPPTYLPPTQLMYPLHIQRALNTHSIYQENMFTLFFLTGFNLSRVQPLANHGEVAPCIFKENIFLLTFSRKFSPEGAHQLRMFPHLFSKG